MIKFIENNVEYMLVLMLVAVITYKCLKLPEMNVISYMLILTASYIACTALVTIMTRSTKQEIVGITIVNIVFALLAASIFFIVSNGGELLLTGMIK